MPLRWALKNRANRFLMQTVLDTLPLAIMAKDIRNDFRNILWNDHAEKMFGISKKEALGKTDFDFLPQQQAQALLEQARRIVDGRKAIHVPEELILHPEGIRWFRSWKVPHFDAKGQPTVLLVLLQDITEIKRYEQETQDLERQLQSISNNAPAIFYQFRMAPDGSYSFPYVSRRCYDYFGLTPIDIMRDASVVINRIHEDDRASFDASMEKTIRERSVWNWEGRFYDREGKIKWIKGASEPNVHDDGSILWDGLLIDFTGQKEAEERIRHQEGQLASASRLAAIGEMAGSVAHEINTPLTTIMMSAERIQEISRAPAADVSEITELSIDIEETSRRIAKIVSGLRKIARDAKKDPLDEVNIVTIVDESLDLCFQRFRQQGVSIEFERPNSPVYASCRAVEIGQVLLNLLNNSFDAVSSIKHAWIRIQIDETEDETRIRVSDCGPGIPKGVRDKIFNPFFTTKEPGKGTGLGLSISQGIMQRHDGRLYVDEHEPNTTFVVAIPRIAQVRSAA